MFEGMQLRDNAPVTFGEPLASGSFADMFTAAERQQRLVNNVFAADQSREELYDRRIAAVKAATGVALENPERGGYSLSERDMRRLTREAGGPIDPMVHRRGEFDRLLEETRAKHPDKAEALTFRDIEAEGREIAKTAEIEGARDNAGNPITSFAASVAGGIWGSRRDPIFVGSLFAGPTSAVGKTALTRIVDAGVRQGLFNMGTTALEQPAVQRWRQEIGVKSGIEPAIENVGMAFLFGMIPGMVFRGGHEAVAARSSVERVLRGAAEPGDVEASLKAFGADMPPHEVAAVRMGEQMVEADRAMTPAVPKDMPPQLHDDMTAAALKRGDDLNAPAPEAVALLKDTDHQLPSGLRVRAGTASEMGTPATDRGAHEIQIVDTAGRAHYRIEVQDVSQQASTSGLWGVGFIENLTREHRGLGAQVYQEAAKYVQDHGGRLVANMDSTNRMSRPIIERMLQDGDAVKFVKDDLNLVELLPPKERANNSEIAARIAEANPQSLREAQMAATEALEEQGTKATVVRLREELDERYSTRGGTRNGLRSEAMEVYREQIKAAADEPKIPAKDPLAKVPFVRDDGTPVMLTRGQVAKVGERESTFAMLVRSCK